MADFDQAERYAIKRLEPKGFLRWLLLGLDDDLVFSRWLETQLAPFPGEPDRRCDCVAEFVSKSGTQPRWACLVEPQGQAQAAFLVRAMQYLLGLHDELRHGPHGQDRYLMTAGIVNLCEQSLQSSLTWVPPGATGGMGLTARVWIRNVYTENAVATLDDIAAGRTNRCILVWIPLMVGGDLPETVERWKESAGEVEDRGTYVGVAKVLSQKRGRQDLWRKGLEGWNVEKSIFIEEWRQEGYEKGLEKGIEKGQATLRRTLLRMIQRLAGGETPNEIAEAVQRESDLDRLAAWVDEAIPATSLEEVRKIILGGRL